MNTLEELTNKIYSEGVEKGKAQAASIVEDAEKKAAAIVEKAKKEADATIKAANDKVAELDKNTRAELRLFADQSVNALRSEVVNLLCDKLVGDNIKAAVADKAFMQRVIAELAASLAKDGEVRIEAKQADELRAYFLSNAKALLDKGVKIEEVKGIKTDFQIVPEKGGYKLAFGEAEFIAYFKEWLRPQLVELLFSK